MAIDEFDMREQTNPTKPATQVVTYYRFMVDGKPLTSNGYPVHTKVLESALILGGWIMSVTAKSTIVEFTYDNPLQTDTPQWKPSALFQQMLAKRAQFQFPDANVFSELDAQKIDYLAYPLSIHIQRAEHILCRRR